MMASVLSVIGQRWRALVGFALLFRILESLLFAPLAALVEKSLLGRTVLDSTAVVSFLLSPRGFLAVVIAAVTALSIRLFEHAGLSTIFFGGSIDRQVSSRAALRTVWQHLLVLVRVSARFVAVGLFTALPLLALTGGCSAWLLPRHDVNYYLKLRPPEFIAVAAAIGIVALGTAAVMFWLVVRWRWVVQVVLFEQRDVREAFAESATLTRGVRWQLAGAVAGVSLASLALGFLASVMGDACTAALLSVMDFGMAPLAIVFGVLLVLRAILGALLTFFGSCLDAGVFTSVYFRRRMTVGGEASLPDLSGVGHAATPRWLPALLVACLTAFAVTSTWLAVDTLGDERACSIHAHRGVSTKAPENTLAAVREAIAAGANYVETDVQLSKDDVLVVAHDSDFSRLAGVAKKVWDLTYDEIRAIPLGSRAAPEFRNECTPTLDALLAETKGRIKVNIELKYYKEHQPGLARKVVDAVRARGMLDQVVIQCLEYEPLLEVRQLVPAVPIGYLLSFNASRPSRLKVDFLSVEQKRLDRKFVLHAHRNGQLVYAWTVNTAEDMRRLLNLGIDGVITDDSVLARKTLEEYLSRPQIERAAQRVQAWLAD